MKKRREPGFQTERPGDPSPLLDATESHHHLTNLKYHAIARRI